MKQRRKPPATKRHRSRQNHPTPWEFMCAIEGRFDLVSLDLAATKTVAKAGRFLSPKQNHQSANQVYRLEAGLSQLFDAVRIQLRGRSRTYRYERQVQGTLSLAMEKRADGKRMEKA